MRWLSAKTHLLAQRKWGENHMASAIDCVYKTFQKIKERPALILQNTFMMNISQSCTDICLSYNGILTGTGEKNNQAHA